MMPPLAVLATLALTASLAAAAAGCSASATSGALNAHHRAPPASYYLALGDSLSQGVQPDASGASDPTSRGYANQLYAVLRRDHPGLRLVKLGCSGETTASMIHGGICPYPGGSQLAAAMRFLSARRSRMSLVTIDIGANDPDSCVIRPSLARVASCVAERIPQTAANLTKILTGLRAADAGVRIIAMTYYLPALVQWRDGFIGRALARVSELAAVAYNTVLTDVYKAFGVRVADVFGAFHTADFTTQVTVPGLGRLPRNVADICMWTWECAAPPRGPNEHANQAGYAVIAHSFLLAGAS
jgi:lysophospholipase L1-like esterase